MGIQNIRHPHIKVELSNTDGNAFALIARTRSALRRAGVPTAEIDTFRKQATSGDYDNVIQTIMAWVEIS